MVELGAVLAGDLEQVGEAGGGDQGRARSLAGQQCVGADGHPVGEQLDRARLGVGAPERRLDRQQYAARLVLGGRRRLRRVEGLAVEQHRIGESAADIDAQKHALKLTQRTESKRPRPLTPPEGIQVSPIGVTLLAPGRAGREYQPPDPVRGRGV